jgi:hypothetical protein
MVLSCPYGYIPNFVSVGAGAWKLFSGIYTLFLGGGG